MNFIPARHAAIPLVRVMSPNRPEWHESWRQAENHAPILRHSYIIISVSSNFHKTRNQLHVFFDWFV